jgi:AraC-like DNA-binding protein
MPRSSSAPPLLSTPGDKAEWWRLILEYNLLIQREYPVGVRLNRQMDNWDRIEDAVPHYYGDNFPNGELSDFDYLRNIRRLGREVWFEFWGFPSWIGQDDDLYADAMLNYTQRLKDETGRAPEVLGIQNEVGQTTERWHNMTLTLRRRLDEAGFHDVKIHMSDATSLEGGIRRAHAFRSNDEVWEAIDYAATHRYDFQNFFHNPDDYDARLREWKEAVTGPRSRGHNGCKETPSRWISFSAITSDLRRTSESIQEVARLCGFRDPNCFSRSGGKATGTSPREFHRGRERRHPGEDGKQSPAVRRSTSAK